MEKQVVIYRSNNQFRIMELEEWEQLNVSYKLSSYIHDSAKAKIISKLLFDALSNYQHTWTAQLYLKEIWKEDAHCPTNKSST